MLTKHLNGSYMSKTPRSSATKHKCYSRDRWIAVREKRNDIIE